jgi:hypothetical protein
MGRRGRRLATEGSCGAASVGWGARSRLSGPEFRAISCSSCSLGIHLDSLSTSHKAVHTCTWHDRATLCLRRADQRCLQSLPTAPLCSSKFRDSGSLTVIKTKIGQGPQNINSHNGIVPASASHLAWIPTRALPTRCHRTPMRLPQLGAPKSWSFLLTPPRTRRRTASGVKKLLDMILNSS